MENILDNPEIKPMKKRYASYDTLAVTNIIITKCSDEEVDGDKYDGIRNRFMGMVRGFGRDFLHNSTPPGTIFHGRTSKEVPTKKIREISSQYVSAFCAPHNCLDSVHKCIKYKSVENKDEVSQMQIVEGIHSWDKNEDFAYGMATSLYEKLPSGLFAGDPVADSLAIVTRDNCAMLALADGVSWGPKSKHASNCSVYGSITYLCCNIDSCTNTKEVFRCILKAFEHAQACIVGEDATLTTLCVAVIVQLQEKDKWCLCVVNVGDSYAYIYNKRYGVKEVTHGSHPIDEARDMRYSGGALGPADGYNPDLANLTCSIVTLDEGDIVFLCSDGISDNFDPAVAKFVPRFKIAELTAQNISSDFTMVDTVTPSNSPELSSLMDLNIPRHKSLGDISQPDALYKKTLLNPNNSDADTSPSPNKVMYFQFDETNPDQIVESSIILDDYYSNQGVNNMNPSIGHTVKKSNDNLCSNEDNNKNENNDNVIGKDTCIINDQFSQSNSNTTGTFHVLKNDIQIIDKEVVNIKDALYSEGVPLTPRERHLGALEQMKEVINTVEFEPINQGSKMRAVDICAQIMNFVINRTAEKRDVLEKHPESEMNQMTSEERKMCNKKIKEQLKDVPGKLDHASIVAYEVGIHPRGSPLKLDLIKSNPYAESLKEHNQPNTGGTPDNLVADSPDGKGSIPSRHDVINHGKQAFSHFL